MTWFKKLLGLDSPSFPSIPIDLIRLDQEIKPPITKAPEQVIFKPTKWVVYQGKIAIVFSIPTIHECVIHYVDEEGVTTEQELVPIGQIRLAKYIEIPVLRRPSQADAIRLGYI